LVVGGGGAAHASFGGTVVGCCVWLLFFRWFFVLFLFISFLLGVWFFSPARRSSALGENHPPWSPGVPPLKRAVTDLGADMVSVQVVANLGRINQELSAA
jgi:hypothetical protein